MTFYTLDYEWLQVGIDEDEKKDAGCLLISSDNNEFCLTAEHLTILLAYLRSNPIHTLIFAVKLSNAPLFADQWKSILNISSLHTVDFSHGSFFKPPLTPDSLEFFANLLAENMHITTFICRCFKVHNSAMQAFINMLYKNKSLTQLNVNFLYTDIAPDDFLKAILLHSTVEKVKLHSFVSHHVYYDCPTLFALAKKLQIKLPAETRLKSMNFGSHMLTLDLPPPKPAITIVQNPPAPANNDEVLSPPLF